MKNGLFDSWEAASWYIVSVVPWLQLEASVAGWVGGSLPRDDFLLSFPADVDQAVPVYQCSAGRIYQTPCYDLEPASMVCLVLTGHQWSIVNQLGGWA